MYLYTTFGLTFASSLLLPELMDGEGKVDVCIKVARSKSIAPREHSPIQCMDVSPKQVHLAWGGVGDLLIQDGQQITVLPDPDADEASLRVFVLGAGLGVLLHQRGLLVLHASGVAIHGRTAIGFVGAKGYGKSTTAASLHRRGHALISDELLVVRFDAHDRPLVIPGSPQIRLWSDALSNLGDNTGSAVRVRPGIDKFNFNAVNIATKLVPFHRLYLLDIGQELAIHPISMSEAFFGIIPHLYVHRFGTLFLQATHAAHAFQQLNLLLKKVIVKRLVRRWSLDELLDLSRQIEQDIPYEP